MLPSKDSSPKNSVRKSCFRGKMGAGSRGSGPRRRSSPVSPLRLPSRPASLRQGRGGAPTPLVGKGVGEAALPAGVSNLPHTSALTGRPPRRDTGPSGFLLVPVSPPILVPPPHTHTQQTGLWGVEAWSCHFSI